MALAAGVETCVYLDGGAVVMAGTAMELLEQFFLFLVALLGTEELERTADGCFPIIRKQLLVRSSNRSLNVIPEQGFQ